MSITTQRRIRRLQERINECYREIHSLQKELQNNGCSHEFVGDYVWEHDNGYGVQSERIGKRCFCCGAIDYWKNGRWHL